MNLIQMCNAGAWILCGVLTVLLGRDFIRTERQLRERRGENTQRTESESFDSGEGL